MSEPKFQTFRRWRRLCAVNKSEPNVSKKDSVQRLSVAQIKIINREKQKKKDLSGKIHYSEIKLIPLLIGEVYVPKSLTAKSFRALKFTKLAIEYYLKVSKDRKPK